MTADNKQIVTTPSVFSVDESFNDERFMKVRIAVMHSGENLNKSSFSTEVIKDAEDTFKNIAILANVISFTDENGETHLDYGGHDIYIEEDKFNEGKDRVIYIEKVVGIVPETNNFEIVNQDDVDYVYVDALLYRDYGNYAVDVLESRGGTTSVSAEIFMDEISFDAIEQIVICNKMRMSGITLLGEDIAPAMKGANATTFSLSNEARQTQMINVMKELTEALNAAFYNGENSEKGGNTALKLQELLEKYGKTEEDLTFEYDGLSDEELEALFAETFGNEHDKEDQFNHEAEAEAEGEPELEAMMSINVNVNGNVHEFSISLKDKINALYQLVNDTYAEDGTWYDVDVFDDDKYVIMVDMWNGKGYKQSYKVKKDVYTLVGDRVEVFATWLTQDEINQLDRMKADYSVMSEKLSHYEEEPKKLEILNSEDYSLISDNDEFVALKETDNHFNMSIDELTAKADAILTQAAKQHRFSVDNNNSVKPLPTPKRKTKRFGSLFDGII